MRNPNGYGGIAHLGGNRRKPYRVRVTARWEYNEDTGREKQVYETLGYYATRKEAMLALAAYNANPYDLDAAKVTFADVYYMYLSSEPVTESMRKSYTSAFKHLQPLHGMRMRNIKKMHLQAALDASAGLSTVYLSRMRALIKNLCTYCIENDIIDKDYSKNLRISAVDKAESIHKPFTAEEINMLWEHLNDSVPVKYHGNEQFRIQPIDTILILIYTGMRPGELLQLRTDQVHLDQHYIIGGSKTDAGKNRIIPIHDEIYPLVKKRAEAGSELLIPYKSGKSASTEVYKRYMLRPALEPLGMNHLPHDGRHTFATFADRYISDKFMIKRIMGHSIKDITQKVYTHKDADELLAAVNRIDFRK